MIDEDKLLRDMQQRYDNLNKIIYKDHPNADKYYERWMEVKYWKEALFNRRVYDKKVWLSGNRQIVRK